MTTRVPEIEIRPFGLAASAFTYGAILMDHTPLKAFGGVLGLEPEPCTCWAGTLALSYNPSPDTCMLNTSLPTLPISPRVTLYEYALPLGNLSSPSNFTKDRRIVHMLEISYLILTSEVAFGLYSKVSASILEDGNLN